MSCALTTSIAVQSYSEASYSLHSHSVAFWTELSELLEGLWALRSYRLSN